MENTGAVGNVKVEIDFGTAHVRMSRHGVPHAAAVEMRHAHYELATLRSCKVNIFCKLSADLRSPRFRVRLAVRLPSSRPRRDRWCARDNSKDKRSPGIPCLLIRSGPRNCHGHIDQVEIVNFESRRANPDNTWAADVQRSQFATLSEVRCSEFRTGGQRNRARERSSDSHNRAIQIYIGEVNRAGFIERIYEKGVAKLLCCHARIANGIANQKCLHDDTFHPVLSGRLTGGDVADELVDLRKISTEQSVSFQSAGPESQFEHRASADGQSDEVPSLGALLGVSQCGLRPPPPPP